MSSSTGMDTVAAREAVKRAKALPDQTVSVSSTYRTLGDYQTESAWGVQPVAVEFRREMAAQLVLLQRESDQLREEVLDLLAAAGKAVQMVEETDDEAAVAAQVQEWQLASGSGQHSWNEGAAPEEHPQGYGADDPLPGDAPQGYGAEGPVVVDTDNSGGVDPRLSPAVDLWERLGGQRP